MIQQQTDPGPITPRSRRPLGVQVGTTFIPIYELVRGTSTLYLVSLPGQPGGPKRRRRWFSRLEAAEKFARAVTLNQPEPQTLVIPALDHQTPMHVKHDFAQPNAA